MDLHFCSQCGISIPQTEIDSGAAGGTAGKYYCTEHRGGGVAVAESPRPAPSSMAASPATPSATATSGTEPELLFCANCQVSIPLGDAQTGRARREFGSLLCAGCSKADPGERAARREAVEAEMASDVRSTDPVVARRCSVCSAAVPYQQIVSGKAKVEGNRVVCERCAAAALAVAPTPAAAGSSSNVVIVLVVLVAGALGYLATQAYLEQKHDAETATKQAAIDRDAFNKRIAELEHQADSSRKAGDPAERTAAERTRVDAELAALRQQITDVRTEASKQNVDLAQRIAKLEGQVAGLSDMVRGLAARAPSSGPVAPPTERPPERSTPTPPVEKPPTPPESPGKKDAGAVNPEVVKYCKDLLESTDDGIRFTAANELAKLKDPASVPSLVKALNADKHYFVRRGCAAALGQIKAWLAVPELIKALEDREVYVALRANQALQLITGNDFGIQSDTPPGQRKTKAQAAEKWWEKNKDHPPDGVCMHSITE